MKVDILVAIVFLIIMIANSSSLFAGTDSGTILSEQRQEGTQKALQNIKMTPPETDIEEVPKEETVKHPEREPREPQDDSCYEK